jgi:predicted choloylglycine hydrolase
MGEELDPHKDPFYWRRKQYKDYNMPVYEDLLTIERGITRAPGEENTRTHIQKLKEDFPDTGYVANKAEEAVTAFCKLVPVLLRNIDQTNTTIKNTDITVSQVEAAFFSLKSLIAKAYLYDTVVGPESEDVRSHIAKGIDFTFQDVKDELIELKSGVLSIYDQQEQNVRQFQKKRKERWKMSLDQADGDIRKATQIYDQQSP